MPEDDAEKIDCDKMEHLSQLVYWVVREVAEREVLPDFQE